ncbi:MAG: Hsp20/alpha crystallin family protein [Oscillospiraceae bacterium]|nr:Hsp20/alpha crystallin family protein [Oscillospiraceae bacterium]
MLPSIFGENLFDDWFSFPNLPEVRDIERKLYGRRAAHEMKTDVREGENGFEVDIDLPGYQKDEIAIHLEKGVLTVSAEKQLDKETENKAGRVIRQERYVGAMQRSFYVGEYVTDEDISAKFENGVLSLSIPKKDQPKLPERKTIAIEG